MPRADLKLNPVAYSLAVLTVAVMTGILLVLRHVLTTPIVALLYLVPVMSSAALWGLGPAIASALAAFLTFNFFFIEPYFTLTVHQTQDLLALIVFSIVAVVVSQLLGRSKASLAEAVARERETTRLYELSTALAGQQDDRAIARVIAEHTRDTFQAARVELGVEADMAGRMVDFCAPADAPALPRRSATALPLMTARGQQGELRIWRDAPFAPAEERLLRTFASQGALAIERARLAQTESRARVLEESDRLKSALLSSVSHELRTPLATIKAAVTSLRGGEVNWDSSAREELLAAIEDETDQLNRLVGNLLDMSRIEAGALNPQRKWNMLSEIVGGAVAGLRQAVQRHRIVIDVSDELPLVSVDYTLIEQVFRNLISNSIKYAPEDTTIHIRAQQRAAEGILVRVINQGPPVPDEHLDRIFDKFHRVTAADRITGTGLGLSICKGIVEAHGGRLWAENLPDGFAFNFTLPLTWEGVPPPLAVEDGLNE